MSQYIRNPNAILYIRNPDIVLREEDLEGGLLFNPDRDEIKVVNATGLFIWKLCDGSRELSAIVEEIQQSFEGVTEVQAAEELQAFLDELVTAGLVGIAK